MARLARRHALFVYELRLWLGRKPAGSQLWGRFRTKAAADKERRELGAAYDRTYTRHGEKPPAHRWTVRRAKVAGGSSYR